MPAIRKVHRIRRLADVVLAAAVVALRRGGVGMPGDRLHGEHVAATLEQVCQQRAAKVVRGNRGL